jgi:hypothetical protein
MERAAARFRRRVAPVVGARYRACRVRQQTPDTTPANGAPARAAEHELDQQPQVRGLGEARAPGATGFARGRWACTRRETSAYALFPLPSGGRQGRGIQPPCTTSRPLSDWGCRFNRRPPVSRDPAA